MLRKAEKKGLSLYQKESIPREVEISPAVLEAHKNGNFRTLESHSNGFLSSLHAE